METYITGNMNGNNTNNISKPYPTKSRSNNNFSQAAVNKTDVGDFHEGYFVMAEMHPHRPKNNNNRTLERHTSEKRNHRPPQQPHRARSTNDMDTSTYTQTRESDSNVSPGRFTTSPHRSPNRNKRNSNSPPQPQFPQSTHLDSTSAPLSPHKPRKANNTESVLSGSPPKDKGPSPTPNRWAGPAFSNAPPPSSLPIPDFPPFQPASPPLSSSPSPSSSPSSSPPPSSAAQFLAHVTFQEPHYFSHHHQPHYPYPYQAHYAFADVSAQGIPTLAQLSTDLRRMLNINEQPVHA